MTFGNGSLARPSFTWPEGAHKPSLLSCITSSQARLGKTSCLFLNQPAKLWGTKPSYPAHRPTPTLHPGARLISLKLHPQGKIFYLYLAILIGMLAPFYLQGLRRKPPSKAEEERLEQAGAARGRCGTQRSCRPPRRDTPQR